MYEQHKRSKNETDQRKKARRTRKMILALGTTLIVIPAILCIVFAVKLIFLQDEVDNMLETKDKNEVTVAVDITSEENTMDVSKEEATTKADDISTNESMTDENTTDENTTQQSSFDSETTTEETTTITVAEPLPSGKYAYLTFDDGPSGRTEDILNILDTYGVKATFFVNGHEGPVMEERNREIVNRGHAIGLHTYTHNYAHVYGGLENFKQEIESLRQYIYDITGVDCTLFRFPGGSSNSIADDIQPYIKWLYDNGYVYYDWNCSSEDASSVKPSAQQIVENCMIQVNAGYRNLVILMHDTNSKDTTVEALPELIERLKANGYEIRAIDEHSTPVHHRELK